MEEPEGASSGKSISLSDQEARLTELYKGTFKAPPKTAPAVKPENVYFISADQSLSANARAAEKAEEGAKALGWEFHLIDGKAEPQTMLNGIREAVSAGADGIGVYAVDCPIIEAGLKEAKAAGIPVASAESLDCDKLKPGSPALFTHQNEYVEGPPETWSRAWGSAQGTYAVVKSEGKAKAIYFNSIEYRASVLEKDGFVEQIEGCEECEMADVVDFVAKDFGPGLQEKAEQAIQQHPEVNVIAVPYDAAVTLGVGAAVRSSGRSDQILLVGGEGNEANIKLVEEGLQDAGVGIDTGWEGYAIDDALLRIFAGEEPLESGIGLQVYDAEQNLPSSGGFAAPFDYAKEYQEAWGIE